MVRPTRLILTSHLISFKDMSAPMGVAVFGCFEDFSVGPLGPASGGEAFHHLRRTFWRETAPMVLPDGEVWDMPVWTQTLPRVDMTALAQAWQAGEDVSVPEIKEVEDLLPSADVIELWSGAAPRDTLWTWYVLAELARLGLHRDKVRLTVLPDDISDHDRLERKVQGLLRKPGGAVIPDRDWQEARHCWDAICAGRATPPEDLAQAAAAADVFRLRAGRIVDPATGLNDMRRRLLRAGRNDWTPMARIVGEAMAAGYDEGDRVGDRILQTELEAMGKAAAPLFDIEGSGPMRNCRVRLTAQGRRAQAEVSGTS